MSEPELSTRPFAYDLSDFTALAALLRPRLVSSLFKLVWVLLAVASGLIALITLLNGAVDWAMLLLLAGLAAFAILLDRFGSKSAGAVQTLVARRSGLLVDQTISLTEEGLHAESARGTSLLRWKAVPRVQRDPDRLFVFLTKRMAYIVPRRAFAEPAQFEHFADAAERRWKAEKFMEMSNT